ncbi:DNA-binding response regulator [Paenibacillus albidus]|uniref:DNA-binding response regulator n=1 Tax=Paenibacillus albidus TaxID=2041023 RepID=A0A917CJI3_9BACL|nr:response regulator transcription factor [Paenibacillus albidus]GGF90838.1 DNA-binding response regulator [Paenibacillus albidus]
MRNVLLVDDEPLIVQGMQSIIDWNANNMQIADTARNGVEALSKLEDSPVDLVITDIMMPQMSGLELIREVKARSPFTKFIILSGYEEFNYVREGITLGVENYLLKPVNIDELEATIKHMQHDWEREEIRQIQMDQSWRILRNNILQRWANETIDAKEFRERALLLEIPMTKSSYNAAALRIVAEPDHGVNDPQLYRPKIAEQCENIGNEQLPDGCEIICFPDQEGDIIVLFASSSLEGEEWQHKALHGMKQWIAADTGACVWGVIGQAEQTYLGFPLSCSKVKQWLQNHLFIGSETSIVTTGSDGEPVSFLEKREPAMEQFHKLLRDGESLEVNRFIDQFFDVQMDSHVARKPFFNSAIQLMLAAKDLEKTPDYGGVFGALSRIHTLSGLKQLVKRVIHQTLDTYHTIEKDYSPHVLAVLDLVKNHYKEELSLKTLSQKLDLHPNYLGQLFQQEAGTSFSDYVNQYRIERATHLLLYSDKRAGEVGAEVGYGDTSYFYRQFKKYAGVSPTELRLMYMKK